VWSPAEDDYFIAPLMKIAREHRPDLTRSARQYDFHRSCR
jgi:hypothetical protein